MSETENKDKQVELPQTGQIELPTIDVTQHIGKKLDIKNVTEHEGNYGYYVKVESEVVEKVGDTEVRASRIFGLQTDESGTIGWGKETKLGLFLEKMKVKHYKELVGKEIIAQTQTSNGKEFLSFN